MVVVNNHGLNIVLNDYDFCHNQATQVFTKGYQVT